MPCQKCSSEFGAAQNAEMLTQNIRRGSVFNFALHTFLWIHGITGLENFQGYRQLATDSHPANTEV